MKKRYQLFYYVMTFIIAQLVWLALLGLWIYWYVSNYIIFKNVGDRVSPQLIYDGTNIFPFVGGLILLVGLSFSMAIIFRHLNIQLKLNRLYDNFIANITHELKSPLASIQLYLETLSSREVDPQRQKEFLGLMIKDADRLKRLIGSILEISALDQRKLAYNYHVYNVDETIINLLRDSAEQFRLPESSLKITGSVNCECVLDINAIRIVFDNLIDNAIKYKIKPVKLNVELNYHTKYFTIDFGDNGVGIQRPEQKKVFNKFYRSEDRNIPNVKGTGLGLYWVREIVKNHDGKIYIINNDGVEGTTFRIELPVYGTSINRYIRNLLKLTRKKEKLSESKNEQS